MRKEVGQTWYQPVGLAIKLYIKLSRILLVTCQSGKDTYITDVSIKCIL
jgi:hypothetical protein